MATYTTAAMIVDVAGQLAVDLRTDDADQPDLLDKAIDYATGQVDFYCSRYPQADLEGSTWVQNVAAFIAIRWLCMHRLNGVPKSVAKEWKEVHEPQLTMILKGEAKVPRIDTTRRAAVVTNYHGDLRRFNNQIRVDPTRSTGVAEGYPRPIDYTAPDQR